MPRRSTTIEDVVASLDDGSYYARCATIRNLCPCRNNTRELELWSLVFERLLHGGDRERLQAAHVIGTLIEKASRSPAWRSILRHFDAELDAALSEPRAASKLLGQLKRHGHAHRGAAMQNLRKLRRLIRMDAPEVLAERISAMAGSTVDANDPGLKRLWLWLDKRTTDQPERDTSDAELLARARRYIPRLAS